MLGRVCPLACCSGFAVDGWLGWLWMGYGRVVGWLWLGGLEGKREVGCRWVVWWAKGGGEKGAGKGVGSGLEGEKGAGKGGVLFPPLFQNPKTEPQPGRCRRSASQTLLLWVCLESLERPTLLLWVWTSAGALPLLLLLPLCRHVAALVQSSTLSRVGVSSRRPHPAEFETGILSHLRLKIRG